MNPIPNLRETAKTRNRYQRNSHFYDQFELLAERRFRPWRQHLLSGLSNQRVLEVGAGTGKNLAHYPDQISLTCLDLTPGMLFQAAVKAHNLGRTAAFTLGDTQLLPFASDTFDAVVSTFVFCSVPDPVMGLKEVSRVLKPGGQVLMLEHMRSSNPVMGFLMDLVNPFVVRMMGANINRHTLENIRQAGLVIKEAVPLSMRGVFKRIHTTRRE